MSPQQPRNALLVIDVQESFWQLPIWPATSAPDLTDRVGRLVSYARAHGDLVVWVLHAEPGTGGPFDPVLGHVRPAAGLEPRDGEPVLTKTSHNAFTTTDLEQVLTRHGIDALTICGIRTEQCCETTARLASDLGYRVTFVLDATATTPRERPGADPRRSVDEVLADPATLPVEAILERTAYALSGRFATISSVDEVTGGEGSAALAG